MDKQELNRRKLLSGILATGGAGALVGRGTTALFTDEETFTNDNNIEASASTAGVVDLKVSIETLENPTGIKYSITLPEGVNNNPSYIWFRAKTCPEPVEAAEDIEVELRVECSESDNYTIQSGTLIEVVNSLRDGTMLQCGDDCLQPGENVDLILEVTEVTGQPSEPIEFEFEFYAKQCRYNTGTENPFEPLSDCGGPTPGGTPDPTPTGNGISFIAFCSTDGETLDPTITEATPRSSEGPDSVEWETENDVDYVVVKAGQNFTIYDYRDNDSGPESGTVVNGGDSDADFYGTVSGSADSGFANSSGSSGSSNSASSVPCELAADIVGDGDFPDDGTSYKLEWDDDDKKFVEDN